MPDRKLVAGLDLGSTKTCAVIAEVAGDLPRAPIAKILGVGLAKNSGVRRGVVRDIDETTRSVAAALKDAERMAGARVPDVTCGIAGEHVSARGSTGVVAVSGEEIAPQDVGRVNEVARAVSLGRDHELLHDIPQEYVVDQQHGISDPVGMTGTRLEVEMYLVTVQATAAQNLRKSVQRAGYRVADLVLEPLAASYAVLTDDEKELGVALVEVGGSSTGVAIFHEGKIRHLASLKYAGSHVTSDLVQGLGVTQSDAERLKERHGAAYTPLVDAGEMVSLPSTAGQGARTASRELVAHIIHQRVDEIFQLVGREFERAGYGSGRGAPAGHGRAGARSVRGAGARGTSRDRYLGTRRQRASAAVRRAGRAGVVRGAQKCPRWHGRAGSTVRRLTRKAVRTVEALATGFLLIPPISGP